MSDRMERGCCRCRVSSFLIFIFVLLVVLSVYIYHVHRALQDLVHSRRFRSSLGDGDYAAAGYNPIAQERIGGTANGYWIQRNHMRVTEQLQQQVQEVLKITTGYGYEIEELKRRLSEVETTVREELNREEARTGGSRLAALEHPGSQQEQRKQMFYASSHVHSLRFLPLKDVQARSRGDTHVHHYFISALKGRGWAEGPPELFTFPAEDGNSTLRHRLLCLRGNSTSDGTQNSYALAHKEELPIGARLVQGTTLISDTLWDFRNPWHSMFNLVQFIYWRLDNACTRAQNLVVFHQAEFRTHLGDWIGSVLSSSGLPSVPLDINKLAAEHPNTGEADDLPIMCFERAIVSRRGIGGMTLPLRRRLFDEMRCQVRRACNIHVNNMYGADAEETKITRSIRHVNVTLLVRQRTRGFIDEGAWRRVLQEQCRPTQNCTWSVIYVANMSFCRQVLGMQAGISVSIQQHMGTIWMDVLQSGTYIDTVQVQLNGGSSWLYQWLVDSLEEWMRTTIEEQLNEQIQQCIQNLNSFLLQTPQQVHVDDVSELNFTVVTEPIVNPTSLSIGIKGEFISTRLSKFGPQHSLELPSGLVCDGDATMVTIALSESILKDGAAIYYNADFLNWLVDQSPVQALLNTTKWKFLIPQLYQKYPNKEIKLQFEVSNPPNVSLTLDGIDVYVTAKMIIGVADNNTNIEAACISIALSGSGIADINGNNITGHLVLNNLCLDLEWSSVGAIHLKLVEVFLRTLVKDFLLPFLNVSLKRGFPLPVIPSMKLKNSAVNYGNGFLLVCSDIEYVKGYPGNLN